MLEAVTIVEVGEQDGGVHGLDQGEAGGQLPEPVAGGEILGDHQVAGLRGHDLYPVGILAGRRLGPQVPDQIRPIFILGQDSVVDGETEIAEPAIADGLLLKLTTGVLLAGALVVGVAVHIGHGQFQLPAIIEGVTGHQVCGPLIGSDSVEIDFAKEDGVQGKKTAQGEILAIVVLIREAKIEGQRTIKHVVLLDHQVFGTAPDFRRAPCGILLG
ncbi:hypothetical protein D3C80_521020 [compost metagenome]